MGDAAWLLRRTKWPDRFTTQELTVEKIAKTTIGIVRRVC